MYANKLEGTQVALIPKVHALYVVSPMLTTHTIIIIIIEMVGRSFSKSTMASDLILYAFCSLEGNVYTHKGISL